MPTLCMKSDIISVEMSYKNEKKNKKIILSSKKQIYCPHGSKIKPSVIYLVCWFVG
jgi:hypothetical protein